MPREAKRLKVPGHHKARICYISDVEVAMRAMVMVSLMFQAGQSLWGLVDCSTQFVEMMNSSTPTQISKDQRFVVDQLGYVAVITDPLARVADYLAQNAQGGYEIRSPEGPAPVAVDPAIGAFFIADARDGAIYVPLGLRSPLFTPLPRKEGTPYTFRYYNRSPLISADGRLVIDAEGDLLWRPSDACQAGLIYARYDTSAIPVSFEYSVKGGRIPLPQLPFDSATSQAIRRAIVAHGGLLTQRISPLSASAFDVGAALPLEPSVPSGQAPSSIQAP